MKFDIWKELVSQSSYLKSRPDLLTLGGGVGGGNRKSWKTLRVEKSGRNLVGRISKCCIYVIDLTVLDPLSVWELGGEVQCFGEFGASGRARTMKIGWRVRELHKLT